jgi:hypothetical protein
MTASMLVKQRHLSKIVGRRRGLRRRVVGAVGRPAARHRRLDAVGGRVGRGRPSLFARMSLGDSTPASRAFTRRADDGFDGFEVWDGSRRLYCYPEESEDPPKRNMKQRVDLGF